MTALETPRPGGSVDFSDDASVDEWYRRGGNFRWMRPRFNVYRPADTRRRVLLNRYPHNVIGAAVVMFGRCWGIQWKGTGL